MAGLLEASPRLIERYQLQGTAALVTLSADHTVPFRLNNPTRNLVTLYRGAVIGTFTKTYDDVQLLSFDNERQDSPTRPAGTENVPVDLTNTDLTKEQQTVLQSLLNKYRDIFALSSEELGRTNLVQHHIDTGDHPPIRQRAYHAPAAEKERIEQCIDDMLIQGIIRPSNIAWASPAVLIKKPDGSDRFCCDLRRVNSVTKKDSYPLPRIADTLDALSSTQYFSSMDLMSVYWQTEMDDKSREETAFITHTGLYESNFMPFGLYKERVQQGLRWKIGLIYFDDVLVYSRTFEDRLQHLRLVFQRFREAGLKRKPKKCHFGQRKVKYLGHVISKDGVYPDPEKVSAIRVSSSAFRQRRAFVLGLAYYSRKFVKDFAKIAGPLYNHTKEGLKFQWTNDCQIAFESSKQALTRPPSWPTQTSH